MPKQPSVNFEELLAELETTVEQLESGNLPLQQTLQLAARGEDLANQCDELLKNAELQLEELVTKTIDDDDLCP